MAGGKIRVGESLVFLLRRALGRFQFRKTREKELDASRIGRLRYPHEHQLEVDSFEERFLSDERARNKKRAND